MTRRTLALLSLIFTLMFAGCASLQPMAYGDGGEKPADPTKSVALLTITVRNSHGPRHQPELIAVRIEPVGMAVGSKEGEVKPIAFRLDDRGADLTYDREKGNSYLLRMELEPGQYVLRLFTGMSRAFPVVAQYILPLHSDFTMTSPGVHYLGHVAATVRERQDNEFRAGPLIPLMDQALAGASTGTFDIVIEDRQETDEAKFRQTFPALQSVPIGKAILPPFDRQKAQQIWDAS